MAGSIIWGWIKLRPKHHPQLPQGHRGEHQAGVQGHGEHRQKFFANRRYASGMRQHQAQGAELQKTLLQPEQNRSALGIHRQEAVAVQ